MPAADPSTSHHAALDRFLGEMRPLLVAHRARRAYLFGSWARGEADPWSDIDVIVVAPTERVPVERFRDYLSIHDHRGERVVLGHSVVQLADGLRGDVPGMEELREAALPIVR